MISLNLRDVRNRHSRALSRHAYRRCFICKSRGFLHRHSVDESGTEPSDPAISGSGGVDVVDFDGRDNVAVDLAAVLA